MFVGLEPGDDILNELLGISLAIALKRATAENKSHRVVRRHSSTPLADFRLLPIVVLLVSQLGVGDGSDQLRRFLSIARGQQRLHRLGRLAPDPP